MHNPTLPAPSGVVGTNESLATKARVCSAVSAGVVTDKAALFRVPLLCTGCGGRGTSMVSHTSLASGKFLSVLPGVTSSMFQDHASEGLCCWVLTCGYIPSPVLPSCPRAGLDLEEESLKSLSPHLTVQMPRAFWNLWDSWSHSWGNSHRTLPGLIPSSSPCFRDQLLSQPTGVSRPPTFLELRSRTGGPEGGDSPSHLLGAAFLACPG